MLIFLTVVGAALLGLIVVVIYLNDRVNELERRAAATSGGGGGDGDANSPAGPSWQGLTGKKLWDVMCGKPGSTTLAPEVVADLRPTYQAVLTQHIQGLFLAGQADARKGQPSQPTATRTLPSPLGSVQSWIPLNHANAIYRAGFDSVKEDIFEVERARMSLDDTAQTLFGQTHLPLAQPFSELMMSSGEAAAPEMALSAPGVAAPGGAAAGAGMAGAPGTPLAGPSPAAPGTAGGSPGGMFAAAAPATGGAGAAVSATAPAVPQSLQR